MKSILKLGTVLTLPAFTGERVYMLPFTQAEGLPDELSRWDETVRSMLEDIDTDEIICLTIDQKHVAAGNTQRRGGLHIDCNYLLGSGHDSRPPGHRDTPPPQTGHRGNPPGHYQSAPTNEGGIITVASHVGAQAFTGVTDGWPELEGVCDHLDTKGMSRVTMQPNQVHVGNITMLHETIPAVVDQDRTFVRLSLPDSYRVAA